MNTTPIYMFSGLGAGPEVIGKLQVPTGFSLHIIDWVTPVHKESMLVYGERMLINYTNGNFDFKSKFILGGVSFGGLIAQALAYKYSTICLVLFSSIGPTESLPYYYKVLGSLGLHRVIPTKIILSSNSVSNWFFGPLNAEAKEVLKRTLRETPLALLMWSIQEILLWKSRPFNAPYFHLKGNKDRILPDSEEADIDLINGAGHLMVYTHSAEVNMWIKGKLESVKSLV